MKRAGPDQIATYWARHERPFQQLGVDGWWPDDGDELPIDARLARHRMYYHGSLHDRPGRAPIQPAPNRLCRHAALRRMGMVGRRLHALGYSGRARPDRNQLLTECLAFLGIRHRRLHTYTRANRRALHAAGFSFRRSLLRSDRTGVSGTPGFPGAGTPASSDRTRSWPAPKAPAAPDPSELHNAQVEPICRRYLELRYRLMPYLYTAVREAHDTGMPIMRALVAALPRTTQGRPLEATNTSGVETSWWPPSSTKGTTHRKLYLPTGRWYDYWSRTPVMGGQEITRYVNLSTMPLYVRAGAILPLDPPRQYVDEPTDQPTTLAVYTGADGEFVLYEDDGSEPRLPSRRGHLDTNALGRPRQAIDHRAAREIDEQTRSAAAIRRATGSGKLCADGGLRGGSAAGEIRLRAQSDKAGRVAAAGRTALKDQSGRRTPQAVKISTQRSRVPPISRRQRLAKES